MRPECGVLYFIKWLFGICSCENIMKRSTPQCLTAAAESAMLFGINTLGQGWSRIIVCVSAEGVLSLHALKSIVPQLEKCSRVWYDLTSQALLSALCLGDAMCDK